MQEKTCTKCSITKPIDQFYRQKRGLYGRKSTCKDCCRLYKQSPEYKTRAAEYYYSEKGQVAQHRYAASEKRKASHKAWIERNKDKVRTLNRLSVSKYQQTEQGKLNLRKHCQVRRARKANLPAAYSENDWQKTLGDFNHRCAYCGSNSLLQQDHFIPLSAGGSYTINNIVPACKFCNTSKHDKMPEQWLPADVFVKVRDYLATR